MAVMSLEQLLSSQSLFRKSWLQGSTHLLISSSGLSEEMRPAMRAVHSTVQAELGLLASGPSHSSECLRWPCLTLGLSKVRSQTILRLVTLRSQIQWPGSSQAVPHCSLFHVMEHEGKISTAPPQCGCKVSS